MKIGKRSAHVWGGGVLTLALALTACGGSDDSGGSSGKSGGTLTVSEGSAPDSLDPGYSYTTQGAEADIQVYTPLLTYAAKSGTDGTALVPGLAKDLPTVSSDGKTYKLQLRSGLKYSDGTAVKASDFAFAVQRSIKLSWGGASFITQNIAGAADYEAGTAQTISGITTDDSTGDITITLTSAYGAFPNILAFVATAPIPSTTPIEVQDTTPPLGVGPYKFGAVTPNQSYELVKNTSFADFKIDDVPTGKVDKVQVSVQSNNTTQAQQVLDNEVDIFDWADTLPTGFAGQAKAQAPDRYEQLNSSYTYYFFMDTTQAPFDNAAARQAVNMAMDRPALAKLAAGAITPGCYFLPPAITGHPDGSDSCPGGDPTKSPSADTVAKAKKMISDAGLAGTPVTVWSQTKSPRQEYCAYYTDLLNELGFKATLNVVQDSVYFQTIGNASTKAQTGFADWSQDFPNPADFYLLLSAAGIQPVNNENFGNVNDPKIESQLAKLLELPADQLQSSASDWQKLDEYVAEQGYVGEFGYGTSPLFTSDRVDRDSSVFNPVYGWLFNTVSLK